MHRLEQVMKYLSGDIFDLALLVFVTVTGGMMIYYIESLHLSEWVASGYAIAGGLVVMGLSARICLKVSQKAKSNIKEET